MLQYSGISFPPLFPNHELPEASEGRELLNSMCGIFLFLFFCMMASTGETTVLDHLISRAGNKDKDTHPQRLQQAQAKMKNRKV